VGRFCVEDFHLFRKRFSVFWFWGFFFLKKTRKVIQRERATSAQTYHPLPVVWSRAKGCDVWDVDGKQYLDFLASYSAVNQGHCHDRLIAAMVAQANKLDLSSRAFYSEKFGEFAEYATKYFGYDRILPMNSGAEAVETAIK
jgi:ornithine--oxo-acid transaminase